MHAHHGATICDGICADGYSELSGDGVHENWAENAFELIVDDFIAQWAETPACRVGQVGLAESVFLDAADLVAYAMPIMEAWARSQDTAPT